MRFRTVYSVGQRKLGDGYATYVDWSTCPPSCPLTNECYAKQPPMGWHADKTADVGVDFGAFLDDVAALPFRPWRYGVAGDLPGPGERIDRTMLRQLVLFNNDREVIAYTHKPLTPRNAEAIREACDNGFTINASCESPAQAAEAMRLGIPAVLVANQKEKKRIIDGCSMVLCPNTYGDVTCFGSKGTRACGNGRPLCARRDRSYVIVFPPHGAKKKNLLKVLEAA